MTENYGDPAAFGRKNEDEVAKTLAEIEFELGDLEGDTEGSHRPVADFTAPNAATLEALRAHVEANAVLHRKLAEITKLGETDAHAADAMLQRVAREREAQEAASPRKFYGEDESFDDLEALCIEIAHASAHTDHKLDPRTLPESIKTLEPADIAAEGRPNQGLEPKPTNATARSGVSKDTNPTFNPKELNIDGLLGDIELGPQLLAEIDHDSDELSEAVEAAMAEETERGKVGAVSVPEIDFGKPDIHFDAAGSKELLKEQIRDALTRLGGTIKDDDPLANDKRRVATELRKVGRNLGDLPSDWASLSRIGIVGERSRQNELNRVLESGRAEMRDAKRRKELAKLGRPGNYDHLSADEKERSNARARQQRHRDTLVKRSTKPSVALPFADVRPDLLGDTLKKMGRRLDDWAVSSTKARARQLRDAEHQTEIIKAAAIYARHFNKYGKPPSQGDLAKGLRCNRDHAARKLRLLKALCESDGPWH